MIHRLYNRARLWWLTRKYRKTLARTIAFNQPGDARRLDAIADECARIAIARGRES